MGLADNLKIPRLACINKFDLNEEMSDRVADYCARKHTDLAGRIPYDTAVTHAMVAEKSIIEFSNGKVSDAIKGIWQKVDQILKG